jgi:Winged helix DNA-binding domain
MLGMGVDERRRRLVRRHALSPDAPAPDVASAVSSMVVQHATDPATVYLSILARCPGVKIDDVARELYDQRSLIRNLAMRRTLWVMPLDIAPVIHHGASLAIAARLRRQLVKDLETGPTDPPLAGDISRWLEDVETQVERALLERDVATAAELSAAEPRLQTAQLPTTDKAYDIRRNITTRVLALMATEGRIVRGRPRGGWTSRHHTWQTAAAWWPAGIPDVPEAAARAVLARRWLEVFGPATVADLRWWTGWTLGHTRAALAELDLADVDLDGAAGIVLADDVGSEAGLTPAAALLPALDPTPMGWQHRDWYLGPHRERLFDRNGNVGPTVWWDGRIVGGWAVRASGEIAWRPLEDAGAAAIRAVDDAAAALEPRLDGAVVVPSFRTPLERELTA